MQVGGPSIATYTPPGEIGDPGVAQPSLDPALVPLLQQLVDVLQQLQALLGASQAQQGAALVTPPTAGDQTPSTVGDQTTTGAVPGGVARASFQVASFNFLGASHTAANGNKSGYRSGAARVPDAVSYLDRHGVDVAGFQEFQGEQQQAFQRAKPGWRMVGDRDNVVAWNDSRFRLVERRALTIPYFEGQPRKMPYVLLEDRATGKRTWVVNVHNPANTRDHPDNERNRDEAMRRERELLADLRSTGVPVLLVGDFNEHGEAPRTMTAGGAATSAAPTQARAGIDWIFGTGPVTFSDHVVDAGTRRSRTSDHPLVVATASI